MTRSKWRAFSIFLVPQLTLHVLLWHDWATELGRTIGFPSILVLTDLESKYRSKGGTTYWASGHYTRESGQDQLVSIQLDRKEFNELLEPIPGSGIEVQLGNVTYKTVKAVPITYWEYLPKYAVATQTSNRARYSVSLAFGVGLVFSLLLWLSERRKKNILKMC